MLLSAVGLFFLSKYVLINQSAMILNIVKVVFALIIVVVAYMNYDSIDSKMKLTDSVNYRNGVVQERLTQIKDAQVEYKKVRGQYAGNFEQLIDFLQNDSIPTVKMVGSVPDSLAGQEAKALELGLISRDTTKNPVRTMIFKENFDAIVDSINYIPFSGGKEFTMAASEVEKGKVKVKVFEAKASLKDIYIGLKTDNEGIDMSEFLAVGSLTEPTTNGNWK
jgi:hypothetical protein